MFSTLTSRYRQHEQTASKDFVYGRRNGMFSPLLRPASTGGYREGPLSLLRLFARRELEGVGTQKREKVREFVARTSRNEAVQRTEVHF